MYGLMMDFPLTLQHILTRSQHLFPRKEIVTKTATGLHRYTYADLASRAARLAMAIKSAGIRSGDRVGTFAWNSYRHLEMYFAVPCSGAVLHTINIRLHPDQLVYMINHAEDRLLFVDASLLPAIAPIRDRLKTIEKIIILDAEASSADQETADMTYEDLLETAESELAWPRLEENQAAIICYTSGTTGHPKGVVYSHRALFLHTMVLAQADIFQISEADTVMPVVPMFHANCWGMPYTCTMVGAKQVFTGQFLQPRDLAELLEQQRVTVTLGVPTMWNGLLHELERQLYDLSCLRMMIVGGAAAPQSMIEKYEKQFGISILHAWGMTETGPLGTVSRLKSHLMNLDQEGEFRIRAKQGLPVPGVEMRAVDESGREVPWDGKTFGEIQVRGPWIAAGYYQDERSSEALDDGWFRTGDVATIHPEGYMQIVDRTKDLVKSGGEWISSVDVENAISSHPKVLEACVIAVQHPKWSERPLACVVPKPEFKDRLTQKEIIDHLQSLVAKWWLPDRVVFIDVIPKTSVGKFDKKVLRERYAETKPSHE